MQTPKYKLKWKKDIWTIEGPGIKESKKNYYQALAIARTTASKNSGELHIYTLEGDLKEIVKCF